MAKLLLIFLSLFLLTSCENKEISVSEEKIISTSDVPTIATPKEQEIVLEETKEESTPIISQPNEQIDENIRELLNGSSIEKIEEIKWIRDEDNRYINRDLFRFGQNTLYEQNRKHLDYLSEYSNGDFQEYDFDLVYTYKNVLFGFYVDENRHELYVNKNDVMEKIYEFDMKLKVYEKNTFGIITDGNMTLFADGDDVYLQYINNTSPREIVSLVYK